MKRMLSQMQRRGPDGSGEWYGLEGTVGLGHRRLSIIDLSEAAAQPMASDDGQVVVTFNGEIYNYRELRAELEARGRHFRSRSDTEVLLHLYQLNGREMLRKLRGMFTFALWDGRRRGLFLARDPFGIKPLYYSDDRSVFHAASQVKALLETGAIDTAPQAAGHVGFFLWGHVPAPFTLYKGISVLPAGSCMWVDAKGPCKPDRYFDIPEVFTTAERGRAEHEDGRWKIEEGALPSSILAPRPLTLSPLRAALVDSVRHHLVADVPVGVFLSAGLDSTTRLKPRRHFAP